MTDGAKVFANTKGTRDEQTSLMRKSLSDALMMLMLEKDYSAITVSDIARKAGVSRMTYYRHFSTKDELLEYRLDAMFADYCGDMMQKQSLTLHDLAQGFCDCFSENKDFLKTLCACDETGIMHRRFLVYLDELGGRVTGNADALRVNRYENACMAGALYGVLTEWAKADFTEPKESIVNIICMHSRYSALR